MTTSLRELTIALEALAAAVSADNAPAYRTAVHAFREAGGSQAQIDDAYEWRGSLRRKLGLPAVSFDVDGMPRTGARQ